MNAPITTTITNLQNGVGEILTVDTGATPISAIFSAGTLTLTGSAALGDYQAVLATLHYHNDSLDPGTALRLVEVVANDGRADSAPVLITVSLAASNNAPSVDLDPTHAGGDAPNRITFFPLASGGTEIASAAVISDPDNDLLTSATVQLIGGDGSDSLQVNTTGTAITPVSPLSGRLIPNNT